MRYAKRRLLELMGTPLPKYPHPKFPPGTLEKPCSVCGVVKPLAEFGVQAAGALGRQARCKACNNLIGKEYTRKHRERKAGRPRPDRCECCGAQASGRRAIHWDHDHSLDRFRGWLCAQCNQALGQVEDSVERLTLLIQYLRRGGGSA